MTDEILIELGEVSERTLGTGTGDCEGLDQKFTGCE